ncbi:MAG: hypothetical protein JO353_12540 [Phycisphaerae bacterium]|nr:hypothetical protein [Phycisphaerae bacterium]
MALPPSQRPRRVSIAYPNTSPLPPSGAPLSVIPIEPAIKPLLLAILIASFAALLILPPIGAAFVNHAADLAGKVPETNRTGYRIAAFFFASYGVWGLAIYAWACCRYSINKGRSWAWGLPALLGSASLVGLALTSAPIAGLFAILGLAGVLLPLALEEDRLQLATAPMRTTAAAATDWFIALLLFIGVSIAYGNAFYGGMTLDNKYIIEEYYHTLIHQDPSLVVRSMHMVGYIWANDYWWPKGISGLYRPLATLSYWANYVWEDNKLDPFQYHVVNLILHWFCAYLGFLLIRHITRRTIVAAAAALLFVTHPIATESVSNIIGRSDVMAAAATFGAAVMYIRSTMTAGFRKWLWLTGMLLVTAAGLFAKESAIAIVGVIVVYDVVYRWTMDDLIDALPSLLGLCILGALMMIVALFIKRFGFLGLSEGILPALVVILIACIGAAGAIVGFWSSKLYPQPLIREGWARPWDKFFLPYCLTIPPIIAWVIARSIVFANASPPETPFLDNPIRGLGFFGARMTASDVFLRLLKLLAFPFRLSCDYSFNQIPLYNGRPGAIETWLALGGLATIVLLLWIAATCYQNHKPICFLILFYFVVYLPTSNFLIIIGSIMAERFLYLPLLAFAACVTIEIDLLSRRLLPDGNRILTCVIVGVLSIGCCVRTYLRNQDWLSDLTLWASAIKVSAVSFRSYQSGAFALFEQLNTREADGYYKANEAAHLEDIDNIIATAEKAKPIVDVLPPKLNSSRLYLHLGMYYTTKADFLAHRGPDGLVLPNDVSLDWYRKAEQVLQDGVVIDRTFNGTNREKELERKIKKPEQIPDVGLPPVYSYLGYDYTQLGEYTKAIETYQYMQHLEPSDAGGYFKIGLLELQQKRFEAAAASIIEAMILSGNNNSEAWQPLAAALAQIQPDGPRALIQAQGRIQLDLRNRAALSALCLAYQNLVETCLLSKRTEMAEQFSNVAKNQFHLPAALFDDLFMASNSLSPAPPPPD